jgi:hypothetical protein
MALAAHPPLLIVAAVRHARVVAPLLLVLSAACSRSPQPSNPSPAVRALDRHGLDTIVGRRVRGDSLSVAGARFQAGWLVPAPDSGASYAVEHLARGRRDIIILKREVGRDGALPVWLTTDAAWLPRLSRSQLFATSCGYGDRADSRLFAVVENADAPWYADVRWAWMANTTTGRLEPATVRGLRCENAGYGGP